MDQIVKRIVVLLSLVMAVCCVFQGANVVFADGEPSVIYRTHVQTDGWQSLKSNGDVSGTTGQSKRLEGINIKLESTPVSGGITYRTHVQTYGWQDWKKDGVLAGTTGEAKRLEAIQIRLTGEMANRYDVYYRVHVQTYGWLDWAKNGQSAGTAGYAKRLEGIRIVLVKKGAVAPGSTVTPFISKDGDSTIENGVMYQTHVQTYGWQDWKYNGSMAGTTGEAKRLEGIRIKLQNQTVSGGISYCTHVQTYGWQDWKSNGQMAGTSGEAKRLEAIRIRLTGEIANYYDVYYRVHVQTYGWLDWAKNGQEAGTSGQAKRLECIEIKLAAKDGGAPESIGNAVAETPGSPTTPTNPTAPHIHRYDAGKVTRAATCTEKGIKTYTCTQCGVTRIEEIPVVLHSWEDITKKVIDSEEYMEYPVTGSYDVWICQGCEKEFTNVDDLTAHRKAVNSGEIQDHATNSRLETRYIYDYNNPIIYPEESHEEVIGRKCTVCGRSEAQEKLN